MRKFLGNLVNSSEFKLATGNLSDLRMQAQELVLRFFAFHSIYNFSNKSINYKGRIETLLDETFDTINKFSQKKLSSLLDLFINSMNQSYKFFYSHCFRKISYQNRRKTPLNKALFTCTSVILSYYKFDDLPVSKQNYKLFTDRLSLELLNNTRFNDAISKSTGSQENVKTQFRIMRILLDEVIKND